MQYKRILMLLGLLLLVGCGQKGALRLKSEPPKAETPDETVAEPRAEEAQK